jgi:hypothetical protein
MLQKYIKNCGKADEETNNKKFLARVLKTIK